MARARRRWLGYTLATSVGPTTLWFPSHVVDEGEVAVATLLRLDLLERSIAGDAYGELGTVELMESVRRGWRPVGRAC
jgi:hypothetical protein